MFKIFLQPVSHALRRRVTCALLANCALLASAAAQTDLLEQTKWTGALGLQDDAQLIEVSFAGGATGAPGGEMALLGFADLGFDVRYARGIPISDIQYSDGLITFRAPFPDRAGVEYRGRIDDGVFSGVAGGGDSPSPFHLIKQRHFATKLHGVYASPAGEFGVTSREYGGYRLIDLTYGRNTSFLWKGRRQLTQLSVDGLAAGADASLIVDTHADGMAQRLTWRPPFGPPAILERIEGFAQEPVRFSSNGVDLYGTLLMPRSEPSGAKPPAAVLVHGSGPIYRTALFERAAYFASLGLAWPDPSKCSEPFVRLGGLCGGVHAAAP